jgi:splicing factor 3B subunit 3
MQPLSYDQLDYAASFNTKEFVGGIVGISGITLRIIAPQRYGELFNQTVVPLSYSPRKMVVHEDSKNLIIIESDNRAYCQRERLERKQELFGNEMNDVPDS